MVTYIYFVKCPDCEDEHFDFFDEAKEFALGCLTKKPIITQTEVTRNDFGECTDHCDLGTVWSWEDMMQDTTYEDDATVFSKNETFGISEGLDDLDDFDIGPQIDEFDNSLDYDFEEDTCETCDREIKEGFISVYDHGRMTKSELYDHLVNKNNAVEIEIGDQGHSWGDIRFSDGGRYSDSRLELSVYNGKFTAIEFYMSDDGDVSEGDTVIETESFDEFWEELMDYGTSDLVAEACTKKPIPEGMTIEQIVEEMEENEDMVECKWCEELFPKEEGRFETGFGGLICRSCQNAAYARGEKMTYKDSDYWDFLDEEVADLTEASLLDVATAANNEFGSNFNERDILDATGVNDGAFFDDLETWPDLQAERKRVGKKRAIAARNKKNLDPKATHDLGNEYDGAYPDYKPELSEVDETPEVSDSHLKLCPECGKASFDLETGICIKCGFN
jgi:hypothetical protein